MRPHVLLQVKVLRERLVAVLALELASRAAVVRHGHRRAVAAAVVTQQQQVAVDARQLGAASLVRHRVRVEVRDDGDDARAAGQTAAWRTPPELGQTGTTKR